MKLFQGDIVLVSFPFSDLSANKLRPAIVVSNAVVNKTSDVILAAITSTPRNDEFSFGLPASILTFPMHTICEVRCHALFTAEKSIVQKKISSLKAKHADLAAAIFKILDHQQ
jgi:mRNA interferase MazF